MQNLEPPEVPLELTQMQLPQLTEVQQLEQQPKKDGFFKRLFSRKPKIQENSTSELQSIPEMELPKMDAPTDFGKTDFSNNDVFNLPALPTSDEQLPNVNQQLAELENDITKLEKGEDEVIVGETTLTKGKSKGKIKKGQKRKLGKLDESSQFDWAREIEEQEILIHDNNRFNQDVNLLMKNADAHIDEKTQMLNSKALTSEHRDVNPLIAPMEIDDLKELSQPTQEDSDQTPSVDSQQRADFAKIATSHNKLRFTLNRYLKNKKLFSNKAKLTTLFKMYDESVEKYIEDKELSLTKLKREVGRRESHLQKQEDEVREMHAYVKSLDDKLKAREDQINNVIAKNVEAELSRRMKTEKKALGEELKKTVALNNDLKKKVKIVEEDRIRFEREHKKMSDTERNKLTELQLIYEKKLRDADAERKELEERKRAFEEKRKVSLELLQIADSVSKELRDVKDMKEYVDKNKKFLDKELVEDKELKHAITNAQTALVKEKENLDNMIFSKYIENKLKGIKPEYLEKREDWKTELKSNPLYVQISQCRKLLGQHNLTEAKSLYNSIRKAYDQVQTNRKEKEALYTAIRELYNEIQLRVVETQMRGR
jgi:hypothetical protein